MQSMEQQLLQKAIAQKSETKRCLSGGRIESRHWLPLNPRSKKLKNGIWEGVFVILISSGFDGFLVLFLFCCCWVFLSLFCSVQVWNEKTVSAEFSSGDQRKDVKNQNVY